MQEMRDRQGKSSMAQVPIISHAIQTHVAARLHQQILQGATRAKESVNTDGVSLKEQLEGFLT